MRTLLRSFRFMLVLLTAATAAGCGTKFQEKSEEELTTTKPCALPWGGEIEHGESTEAFSASNACAATCSSIRIVRTCNNGVLSGDSSFNHPQCQDNVCRSCSVPWGGVIMHGTSVNAYRTLEVACGGTCAGEGQLRTCNNGVLSGSNDYGQPSCTVRMCPCTLPGEFGPGTAEHGSEITAYRQSTVLCRQNCDAEGNRQVRACNNGTWTGDAAFTRRTCSVNTCRNCSFGVSTILDMGTVQGWNIGSSPCGDSCGAHQTTRRCEDGTFTRLVGGVWVSDDQYTFSSCSDGCVACALPWGGSLPNGQTVQAYRTQHIAECTASPCLSQRGTLRCDSPSLVLVEGSGTVSQYLFDRCTQSRCSAGGNPPRACRLPWEFYVNSSLYSGYVPDSAGQYGSISPDTLVTMYSQPEVPCAESCETYRQVKQCDPDGYFVLLSEVRGNRGGTGASYESAASRAYKHPFCRRSCSNPEPALAPNIVANCHSSIPGSNDTACIFFKNPQTSARVQTPPQSASLPYPLNANATQPNSIMNHRVDLRTIGSSSFFFDTSFSYLDVPVQYASRSSCITDEGSVDIDVYASAVKYMRGENRSGTGGRHPQYFSFLYSSYTFNRMVTHPDGSGSFRTRDYPAGLAQTKHAFDSMIALSRHLTGGFYAEHRGIGVLTSYPLLNNALFSNGWIVFGQTDSPSGGTNYALDSSIGAHELGHANLRWAMGSAYYSGSGHTVCGPVGQEEKCCPTNAGCFAAINEGQADYHAMMLFPDYPGIAEILTNDGVGLRGCGIPRNAPMNFMLTRTQAYTACAAPYQGEVHVMGALYASIWWKVRSNQFTQLQKREIDKLFLAHLAALRTTDTFNTVVARIEATDIGLFGTPRYGPAFRAEFIARGFTP